MAIKAASISRGSSKRIKAVQVICFALAALLLSTQISGPFTAYGSSLNASAPAFQHIFVIVLENSAYESVMSNDYFADLAKRGLLLSNYKAVAHPSQPNYIAMIGGDTFVTDNSVHNLPQSNLVDLLESAGVSWKTYQENYPGNCFDGATSSGGYARKHNPFISFDNIRNNSARCAKIVNASALDADIAAGKLPQFSFYTPNLSNDGHDTSYAFAANWLKGFLEPKLANPAFMNGTLVIVTFDEDDNNHGNHIYTVLLGTAVTPGVDTTSYTHYSLLRTIEDNFQMATLGLKDTTAMPFSIPGSITPTPSPTPVHVTPRSYLPVV